MNGRARPSLPAVMVKQPAPPKPMEARLVERLPDSDGWQFEPKWDGFRALIERDAKTVRIWSKSGKPLGRYFPDIVAMLRSLDTRQFVVDGELIVPVGNVLSFAALQSRLHPSETRVRKLAAEHPAQLMAFDCLGLDGEDLAGRPLAERRPALERFHARAGHPSLLLSPASTSPAQARHWLDSSGGALDGVVAKRLDEPYRFGERAMQKVKLLRTADCVVGGYRTDADGNVASLLLGLFDAAGLLDHVGFTSAFSKADRSALKAVLAAHAGPPGFTGKSPGGPSRWSDGEERPWLPLRHELVAEIVYDQVTAHRFRHGTRFLRWRPDKPPASCTFEQLGRELAPRQLKALLAD